QIPRLLHDANLCLVASRIAANRAKVSFRQVVAAAAVANIFADVADGVRQADSVSFVHTEQMVGQTLGRFSADARQLAKLVDEPADRLRDLTHCPLPSLYGTPLAAFRNVHHGTARRPFPTRRPRFLRRSGRRAPR